MSGGGPPVAAGGDAPAPPGQGERSGAWRSAGRAGAAEQWATNAPSAGVFPCSGSGDGKTARARPEPRARGLSLFAARHALRLMRDGGPSPATPPAASDKSIADLPAGAIRQRPKQQLRRLRIPPRPGRGRYLGRTASRLAGHPIAWDDSLRHALAVPPATTAATSGLAVTLPLSALRRKLRAPRPQVLVLLVVDVSGSMGTSLMALAREVAERVLEHAYVRRLLLALIAFRAGSAELVVRPGRQPEHLRRRLAAMRCGGTTPLAAALGLTAATLARESRRQPLTGATVLLITDGQANVTAHRRGASGLREEVDAWARRLAARPGLRMLFLDTTEDGKDDRPASDLAVALGARHVRLAELNREGADPVGRIAGWVTPAGNTGRGALGAEEV
ncbi:MAG: VWA domain-containing protein [Candidatus Schekmanbacteria bacterium]|nr:VWA domain-containing protein [Candidatus Schekmanbacteria bacterium]